MKVIGTWRDVADAARTTMSMGDGEVDKEPSPRWKRRSCLNGHSPIRVMSFNHVMHVPYWVAMHLVRHHVGCVSFVGTQRTDRTGTDDRGSQNNVVPIRIHVNTQGVIDMARKRMCMMASVETRAAWQMFLDEVRKVDPILADKCVPECVYRGFCPEDKSCGLCQTESFQKMIKQYREV